MKRICFAGFVFFISLCSLNAQSFSAELSYSYFYSGQFDKAIQTYNFSRPHLSQKQPLLMHGASAGLSYLFRSDRSVKQGIGISYSRISSTAENDNWENTLNLHVLDLSYLFHHEYSGKFSGLYAQLLISAKAGLLNRHINGEPLVVDDENLKATGIGGSVHLKSGYYLKAKGRILLSPYIAVGYCPFLYAPNAEGVINQTQELSGNSWTALLNAQLGVGITFNRKTNAE